MNFQAVDPSVLVALIGSVAAFLGTVIVGSMAYWGVKRQSEAQTELANKRLESESEYLKIDQQEKLVEGMARLNEGAMNLYKQQKEQIACLERDIEMFKKQISGLQVQVDHLLKTIEEKNQKINELERKIGTLITNTGNNETAK